jgi:cyclophilin family peptidyl-prolyl cis-trans isomerase
MMHIRQRLAALLLGLLALPAAADTTRVLMETSKGAVTIELDAAKAPLTVANFLEYVDAGFYNGTVFHRVIPDFMIQGGGFEPGMRQKPTGDPVRNEAANGLTNQRGTIAMARTRNPHSATAQFFINLKHNDFLDHPGQDGWGYAVFGRVTDGMAVVDAIADVKTGTQGGHRDVPRESVIIESLRRLP